MLESWANRRKNVRLVAEVVGDRKSKISRSKVLARCSKLPTFDSKSFCATIDRSIGRMYNND